MRRSIIIIGGDVGAGKTTHAKMLLQRFRKNDSNVKVRYYELKGLYYFAKLYAILLCLITFLPQGRSGWRTFRRVVGNRYNPFRLLIKLYCDFFIKNYTIISFFNLVDVIVNVILRYYLVKPTSNVLIYEDHIIGYMNDFMYFLHVITHRRKSGIKYSRCAFLFWYLGLIVLHRTLVKSKVCIIFLTAPYSELEKRYYRRRSLTEFVEYVLSGRYGLRSLKRIFMLDAIIIKTLLSSIEVSNYISKRCAEELR